MNRTTHSTSINGRSLPTNYSQILCHLRWRPPSNVLTLRTHASSARNERIRFPVELTSFVRKHRRTIDDVKLMWWVHNCTRFAKHLRATGMPMGIAHSPSDGHTFIMITTINRRNSERSPRLGNNAQTNLLGEVCVCSNAAHIDEASLCELRVSTTKRGTE